MSVGVEVGEHLEISGVRVVLPVELVSIKSFLPLVAHIMDHLVPIFELRFLLLPLCSILSMDREHLSEFPEIGEKDVGDQHSVFLFLEVFGDEIEFEESSS